MDKALRLAVDTVYVERAKQRQINETQEAAQEERRREKFNQAMTDWLVWRKEENAMSVIITTDGTVYDPEKALEMCQWLLDRGFHIVRQDSEELFGLPKWVIDLTPLYRKERDG
jgi:predicted nucleotide-binding protein (sugar kinase/HSP70/actin superfamily)